MSGGERCPVCDRAVCPNFPPVEHDGTEGDRDCPSCAPRLDCEAHRHSWRDEALALRASFASQAQVTVTARQAVSDVVVERDAALALVAKLREGLQRAIDDSDYCYACEQHPSRGHRAGCPVVP